MRPNSRITRTTLRVQLPEGNATSQTMKRFLLLLKILHETWMSPSSTTWATDVILASACGLAHLIPLIPHLRTNLAFLLTGKRNNRKHHRKKSRWNQSREQSRTQRTCRDCPKEVVETRDPALFMHRCTTSSIQEVEREREEA
ncbi:spermatogenesis-associated protein 31E1 isoform X3 [Fukomys damarensis]|uniref:spermatogenesis-associated protein 31E1 isoform X3 n=1 Tax=Fukomys damarensis TaxID=885580 RepID=UPI0014558417|nr:spermatogenesis-associated protein 31E1 isoform X3 [Fukomys damarensis]